MTKKERNELIGCVDNEGFDYCFRFYDEFLSINDKEFHRLRQAYIDAAQALSDYIGVEDA